jgi:general secretion pathway protein C
MLSASWRPAVIALNLVLLAMIAYSGARIANAFVTAQLDTPATAPRIVARIAPVTQQVEPASAYAAIYERDVFNATHRATAPDGSGDVRAEAKRTDLNVKLWGTAIDSDPRASHAIIEDLATRAQALYRIGDTVLDVATLTRVEWDRVVLERDGVEEVLDLELQRRGPNARGAAVPAAGRIQRTADNKFVIDRREVEKTVKNLNEVFTQARAVPHFQDGTTVGFRVFQIKPGSVFERIGLKNGDVVKRVNGVELTDPTKAITLFTELQNEGHIAVDLERNRKAQSFSYEIR